MEPQVFNDPQVFDDPKVYGDTVIFDVQTFAMTRPKPPYERQGLAGLWGKDTVRRVHFGGFKM